VCLTKRQEEGAEQARSKHHNGDKEQGHAGKRVSSVIVRSPTQDAVKISHQLRAAENRIAELEAEVGMYEEKGERAEQGLHRVYTEIDDRFLRQDDGGRGSPQRRQRVHSSR
jgi:hypothetical protein